LYLLTIKGTKKITNKLQIKDTTCALQAVVGEDGKGTRLWFGNALLEAQKGLLL